MQSGRARARVLPRSSPGLAGAALLWTAGLAPSLLPRPAGVAIVLAGVLAACGYGLGCAVAWGLRRLVSWSPGPRVMLGGRVVTGLTGLWAVVMTVVSTRWQAEQAAALGMSDPAPAPAVLLVAGLGVGWSLVLVGRGLRGVARRVNRFVSRRSGRGWGSVLGAVAAAGVVVGVLAVAYAGIWALFSVLDGRGSGQPAPSSPQRTGGPGSFVAYAALGTEGQRFVDGGPTVERITTYAGKPAMEPIRVYVGLAAADSAQARAQLAVQELQRTGAFHRRLLVVAITTGNGYLDPTLVDAPEFLTGGDVATVATQYSVLPSWLSFLVDQKAAGQEAQALWQAVRQSVDALPPGQRPQLATSGESLGAFGGQAVFAGLAPDQVTAQAAATVWVGSPGASPVWTQWRDTRSSGPPWEPVIGDDTVARDPATAASGQWTAAGWVTARVVLTQHANDPVSWWAPGLLLRRPDWLTPPLGPGVDPRITWWPGVFFLQTGLDLVAAGAVPAGVGHNYGDLTAQAWAYALNSPGADGTWTTSDTTRLNDATGGT